MRAVIVGGGIAGSATAIALSRIGMDVLLLERRSSVAAATGSYLTVAPNGLSALDALGVLDTVASLGFPSRYNVMYGANGRLLGTIGQGAPVRAGLTALTLKRAALAACLGAAAESRGVVVRREVVVTGMSQTDQGVEVRLSDGTTEGADLLVGADGVHSAVRGIIDPAAPSARYVGLTNFGGVTEKTVAADDLDPEAWHFVFGRQAFFGAHPTPAGDVVWFVNVPEPEITRDQRTSISEEAWRARLAGLLAHDAGPAADLVRAGRLELAGDNTYDLAHVGRWSRGRMVLVGDALHAPSPSSGQGASMALEDAVVLAQALRDRSDIPSAFAAYEQARRRRVERIVKVGARSSSSKIPGPISRRVTETMMTLVFRYVVTDERAAWMNGYRLEWDAPVTV